MAEAGERKQRAGTAALLARRLSGALAVAVLLLAGSAPAAQAQTILTGWGGVFMDPQTVRDGETGTVWDFGTSFAGGLGVERWFGQALMVGAELGYSPMQHEVRSAATGLVLDEGKAHLLSALVTGRLGGSRDGFSTYLAGGIGTVVYGIPHLDQWDPDFALRAGTGFEYGFSGSTAVFLQYNRWWIFHQSEGVDDNTANHPLLQLGLRFGG